MTVMCCRCGWQKAVPKRITVSIFVNPTQFAPSEDFSSYPRTWKPDIARLAAEGVDLVWNPDVTTMYPDGFAAKILTAGPATAGPEDRFRPHFFGGVTTVVFGEKDFQQFFSVKDGPPRILAAAKLGRRRLIDNLGV